MNILYFAVVGLKNSAATAGVRNKLEAQRHALLKLGHYVKPLWVCYDQIDKQGSFTEVHSKNKLKRRIKTIRLLEKKASEERYDMVYIRYPLSDYYLAKAIHNIRQKLPNTKIIFERQAIEVNELSLSNNSSRYYYLAMEKLFSKSVSKKVDCNVCVTEEIKEHLFLKGIKNSVVMSNGTKDLSEYSDMTSRSDGITLTYLGNLTYWSGLDLFIKSMNEYRETLINEKVVLNIIGDGVNKTALEKLVVELNLTEFVRFLGYLEGDKKYQVLNLSDLGLGSLNNSTRGLKQGANLKIREYCSLGVPFVKTEYDSDIDGIKDIDECYLDIDGAYPMQVKFEKIISFAKHLKPYGYRQEITSRLVDYAIKNLTWETKYEKLFALLGYNDV